MHYPRKIIILTLALGVFIIFVLLFFFVVNKQEYLEKINDQTPRSFGNGGENNTPKVNDYDRATLVSNCAKEIPTEKVDDTFFDPQKKIVRIYWWDNDTSNNVSLTIPFEPEKDFNGCSESIKEILRHIQQAQL